MAASDEELRQRCEQLQLLLQREQKMRQRLQAALAAEVVGPRQSSLFARPLCLE